MIIHSCDLPYCVRYLYWNNPLEPYTLFNLVMSLIFRQFPISLAISVFRKVFPFKNKLCLLLFWCFFLFLYLLWGMYRNQPVRLSFCPYVRMSVCLFVCYSIACHCLKGIDLMFLNPFARIETVYQNTISFIYTRFHFNSFRCCNIVNSRARPQMRDQRMCVHQ